MEEQDLRSATDGWKFNNLRLNYSQRTESLIENFFPSSENLINVVRFFLSSQDEESDKISMLVTIAWTSRAETSSTFPFPWIFMPVWRDIVYVVLLDILSGYHHHNFLLRSLPRPLSVSSPLATLDSPPTVCIFQISLTLLLNFFPFNSSPSLCCRCRLHRPPLRLLPRLDIFTSLLFCFALWKYYKTYFPAKWNKNGFSWSIGVDKDEAILDRLENCAEDSISIQFAKILLEEIVCCNPIESIRD